MDSVRCNPRRHVVRDSARSAQRYRVDNLDWDHNPHHSRHVRSAHRYRGRCGRHGLAIRSGVRRDECERQYGLRSLYGSVLLVDHGRRNRRRILRERRPLQPSESRVCSPRSDLVRSRRPAVRRERAFGGTLPGPSGDGVPAFVEFTTIGSGLPSITLENSSTTEAAPVPEPASLLLLGPALLFVRRLQFRSLVKEDR
jgi:hypothetical protein